MTTAAMSSKWLLVPRRFLGRKCFIIREHREAPVHAKGNEINYSLIITEPYRDSRWMRHVQIFISVAFVGQALPLAEILPYNLRRQGGIPALQ